MGRVKDLMIQQQEDEQGSSLAKALGISYFDLQYLDYEIEAFENPNGYNMYVVSFPRSSPKNILDKIKNLDPQHNTVTLEAWELDDNDDYEDQYEAITSNKNSYITFQGAIEDLKNLNEVALNYEQTLILKRQIYLSVISSLEAFLSETFINLTNDNSHYFKKFIETHEAFTQRKITVSKIIEEYETLHETAKETMIEIVYHNLPKVARLYRDVFEIDFPNFKDIIPSIGIRHDLVHRNGKTHDGDKHVIEKDTINDLIGKVSVFAEEIADKLELQKSIFLDKEDTIDNLPF